MCIGLDHVDQTHHDAGGAKAALRAVALDHFFLHRMERAIGLFQTLYRFDRLAIERWKQLDAGIGRHIVHARTGSIEFSHHHHTRTTVALCASFFGSGTLQLLAQIVQNGGGAALTLGFNDLSVEHKAHGVGGLGHMWGALGERLVILGTRASFCGKVCTCVYKI